MNKFTISYAQNREDVIINAFFDDKADGFYVDVGANHPTKDSVTKLFYNKGWHGINIEPNKELALLLRADRPRDVVIDVGIGAKKGAGTFRNYAGADGLSTFVTRMQDAQDDFYTPFKQDYTDTKIEITTLANVLRSQNVGRIDFMKIDVEGYEYEVIAGNDWERYRPELICIEANHIGKDWRPILRRKGYVKFFDDGLNDYYALKGSKHLDTFSFPEKVFMRLPKVVPFVPNSDMHSFDDAFYEEEIPKEIAGPSVRDKIIWSLSSLRDAINEALILVIVRRKRLILRSRVQKDLKRDILYFGNLRFVYTDMKLQVVRFASVSVMLLFKIGSVVISNAVRYGK